VSIADDLRDGGAQHFVDCIRAVRELSPGTKIEILTPDFRGRLDRAIGILDASPPDVMNHNLETVPRLLSAKRAPDPTTSIHCSCSRNSRRAIRIVPTKSGLMVGLGETNEEILEVMRDLRAHHVDMLTIGQYLQPSKHHLPVIRFAHPDEFRMLGEEATKMGFVNAASGPMVRFELPRGPASQGRGRRRVVAPASLIPTLAWCK